eukprot:CAMPEP_0114627980 /NCGR_PEP_ID=MMETSP0168-20121206/12580_1 /TAXON_ID=95228 ORGANISM="Vannella sp., Strain DIVA3 517/6/12" /NCGR_SAMPLE_ID=MMETSP0168 /ASSEMBLY_ACC=CAM_ASM_000044 /LENGTH=141 /DNA_ID=CAMNT_0001839339 /DNA_START=222 /DNA_END=645 /DNA_ORIENTATION=-
MPSVPACLSVNHLLETVGEDAEFFSELLGLFKSEFVKNYRLLEQDCNGKDTKDAELHAHSIKSSAANVGAVRLQVLGKSLQEYAAAGNFDQLLAMMPAVKASYEEAAAALQQWIDPSELAAQDDCLILHGACSTVTLTPTA